MPHYGYINPIDIGAEPDDAPSGRCYGPAYPDAPGCGRFARGGMCERCQEKSREYWKRNTAEQIAYDASAMAEYARQEAEYIRTEMAAHPPMIAQCDWCGDMTMCAWQAPGYICVDRAQCDARCLEIHEQNIGFQEYREWGRDED